ncbi:MAG: hypothetical protein P4L77_14605 [Sulfuriferula sp.]|nr:hypothetical protein [Sulfuriferula sp.]
MPSGIHQPGGVALSGFTNSEITQTSGTTQTIYRQTLVLRQTWNQGGGTEHVEADQISWPTAGINIRVLLQFDCVEQASITADFQHIGNSAYNADRGPLDIISARLHTEF